MNSAPRVLIANDDVSDLLVLRRLLRDTPYAVDTVRSASQALLALAARPYAAVVADDERLADMAGGALLAECERLQASALRLLLARRERSPELDGAAALGRYQLVTRPFFAKPLLAALTEHVARLLASEGAAPQVAHRDDDTQRTATPFVEDEADAGPAPGRMAQRRVLLTMVEMVEAKSGHASGHGARVSALAGVLAREVGLRGDALEAVEDAALVHDVGELALDGALLMQRRRLSDDELRSVRHHVVSSWQIVRRAGLSALTDAVRLHHERWDGDGYPDGRRGDAIPLAARIIAVADTWDALATDRPYRSAVALDECVRVFADLAGNQLDPTLVRLYLDRKIYDLIDWSDPPRPGVKLL